MDNTPDITEDPLAMIAGGQAGLQNAQAELDRLLAERNALMVAASAAGASQTAIAEAAGLSQVQVGRQLKKAAQA